MLEIKITAPEISEAINNLARAIGLAVTNPVGMTIGATHSNTTCAAANQSTSAQTEAPAEIGVNPTTPASVPQTVPTVPNTQTANCHTPDLNPAPTQTVPTAAPQYTLDMIAKAGTALIDAGKMGELTALLAKYGVEALTALDPAHYGAFVNELRALGASI